MKPAIRINRANADHHLWNNHGTFWVHYTVYPTPIQKQRVRASLRTKSLDEAREKRDSLFLQLATA